MNKNILAIALIAGLTSFAANAKALTSSQYFGSGANAFSLDFQYIGNAGNAADNLTGYGSVNYNYNIGTYSISARQYNAVYNSGVTNLNYNNYYEAYLDGPAGYVSWYQAARFVNWLNTSSGFQAAYNLTDTYSMDLWQSGQSGYDTNNPYRNSLAVYVLPTENEWYKAAYYNPANTSYNLYPTGNSAPTAVSSGTATNTAVYGYSNGHAASVKQAGGLSPYGTMGQGGNAPQWMESANSGVNTNASANRAVRGGDYNGNVTEFQSTFRLGYGATNIGIPPQIAFNTQGFRVAQLLTPEIAKAPSQVTPKSTTNSITSGSYYNNSVAPVTANGGFASTAAIIGGTASSDKTVTVAFNNAASFKHIATDVVSVSGNAGDTFALKLTYDLSAANALGGAGNLRLLWLNPLTGEWVNAVDGNIGGTPTFMGDGAYDAATDLVLGYYGVDTADGYVWAVVNHNSDFAGGNLAFAPQAVPEPSTYALFGLGALALLIAARRKVA